MKEKILVSYCLIGKNCKYDGTNNYSKKVEAFLKDYIPVFICPEEMGGLPTPRVPAERRDNLVITKNNKDVTLEFVRGAEAVLKIAKEHNIKKALLKSHSPSCGTNSIYDGTFTHTLIKRDGVTAELLKKNDIEIITSDEIEKTH